MPNKHYEHYIKPVLSNMDNIALDELNINNLAHDYLEQIRSPRFRFHNKHTQQIIIHQLYWCILGLYTQTSFFRHNVNDVCTNANNNRLKLSVTQGQEKNVRALVAELSDLPLLPVDEMLLGFTQLTQIAQLGANNPNDTSRIERNIPKHKKFRTLFNVPLHILNKERISQVY